MIGDRLKYYRTIQNLTQRELAECAGMKYGVVGKIESTNKPDIMLSTAIKLRDALELESVDDLMLPVTARDREEMFAKRAARRAYYNELRLKRVRDYKRRAAKMKKLTEGE